MESADNKDGIKNADSKFNQEIYSKVVRAGKRTYFFDVKTTRSDEYYITITESKKRYSDNGKFHYEKNKIFLYKEDFEKFAESLQDIVSYIQKNQPETESDSKEEANEEEKVASFSNVDFEDI